MGKFILPTNAGGSSVSSDGYNVKFLDYDGSLIKSIYVAKNGNATPPEAPNHEHLTFKYWKGVYQNVTRDTYVGAVYEVIDDECILFIKVRPAKLTINLYLYKDDGSPMVIDWGDNTTFNTSDASNFNIPHTYTVAGYYKIRISCSGNWKLGNTSNVNVFNRPGPTTTDNAILMKAYLPKTLSYMPYSLGGCYEMKSLVISDGTTLLAEGVFYNMSCKFIVIPDSVNTMNPGWFGYSYTLEIALLSNSLTSVTSIFTNCKCVKYIELPSNLISIEYLCQAVTSMKNIYLPETLTTIGNYSFKDANGIDTLIIPASVTSMSGYQCLHQMLGLTKLIVKPVVPPTLATTSIGQYLPGLEIFVPDESLAAYKAATNWSALQNIIYPISQLQ